MVVFVLFTTFSENFAVHNRAFKGGNKRDLFKEFTVLARVNRISKQKVFNWEKKTPVNENSNLRNTTSWTTEGNTSTSLEDSTPLSNHTHCQTWIARYVTNTNFTFEWTRTCLKLSGSLCIWRWRNHPSRVFRHFSMKVHHTIGLTPPLVCAWSKTEAISENSNNRHLKIYDVNFNDDVL